MTLEIDWVARSLPARSSTPVSSRRSVFARLLCACSSAGQTPPRRHQCTGFAPSSRRGPLYLNGRQFEQAEFLSVEFDPTHHVKARRSQPSHSPHHAGRNCYVAVHYVRRTVPHDDRKRGGRANELTWVASNHPTSQTASRRRTEAERAR